MKKPGKKYTACFLLAGVLLLLSCAVFENDMNPFDMEIVPDAIRINEVMVSNKYSLTDQFGDSPDWIELYNSSDIAVDLKGYCLSDDPSNPRKWECGSYVIQPGDFCILCASERNSISYEPGEEKSIGVNRYVKYWADKQAEPSPSGNSVIMPDLFEDNMYGLVDGNYVISAKIYLDDNDGIFLWREARITMPFKGSGNPDDYSQYDKIRIVGNIEKNKNLMIRISQDTDIEYNLAFGQTVTGNGIENYHYDIIIANEPRIDRTILTGIQFAGVDVNDTVTIKITDVIFIKTQSYLHTNFSLSSGGERLIMTNPAGDCIDKRELHSLSTDVSQGRKLKEPDTWIIFEKPTPGAPNQETGYTELLTPVEFTSSGGFYDSPIQLTLLQSGTDIYYTDDGSSPTENAHKYIAPFGIDSTTVIRSRSYFPGTMPSRIQTNTYFINEKTQLPVISIATCPASLFDPDTGMYEMGPHAGDSFPYFGANFWEEREMPVHLEFYEPDRRLGFKCGAGMQIFGNYSRGYPKKSLAIFFRKEYGPALITYPLFPDSPGAMVFESFILRNNGANYQRAMFEDALQSSLAMSLGLDAQKYRPSIVFINGDYWGIHNIREKLNAGYLKTNHYYEEGQVDLIKGWGEIQAGDKSHYEAMWDYMKSNDMSQKAHYDYIATQMDMDNFIDYNNAEIYFVNTDWPANNRKWWRPKKAGGKWKWIVYDCDGGFGVWGQSVDTSMIAFATDSNQTEWPNPEWSTFMLRTLLKNEEFRRRFINRAATLLSTNFETNTVLSRIDEMAAVIEGEIPRDYERWETAESDWTSAVWMLTRWANLRPDAMRKNYNDYFNLNGTVQITLNADGGSISIDGIIIQEYPYSGVFFNGNPITLKAESDGFMQWSDGDTARERMIDPIENLELIAIFE